MAGITIWGKAGQEVDKEQMPHILIASSVNKDIKILREFLSSLCNLEQENYQVSYCFVDDNSQAEASLCLAEFVDSMPNAMLLKVSGAAKQPQEISADHNWDKWKIARIARIKNQIIGHFLGGCWSHLFLVDADVLLQPPTLTALLASNKDIIANIFWTKWQANSMPLPQVWQKDFYTLHDDHMLVRKTEQQKQEETLGFLLKLQVPGIYRVGGLGACTLISRKALLAGVNFDSLYNISFWGEDRSFCIRAVALGFELFVHTVYPAFHIFRIEDLQELPSWHNKN